MAKAIIIVVVIIIVILVLGGGGFAAWWFLMRNKNNNANGGGNANSGGGNANGGGGNANTGPFIPSGSQFLGCYNAPVYYDHDGDGTETALPLGHNFTQQLGCTEACPQQCYDAVKNMYGAGGHFAVDSSGGCRGGGVDERYDNGGEAMCGSSGSWQMYSIN